MTQVVQTGNAVDAAGAAARFLSAVGPSAQGQEGIFASLLADAGESFSGPKIESARVEPKAVAPEKRDVAENYDGTQQRSKAPERAEPASSEAQDKDPPVSNEQSLKTGPKDGSDQSEKAETKAEGPACEGSSEKTKEVLVEKGDQQEKTGPFVLGEGEGKEDISVLASTNEEKTNVEDGNAPKQKEEACAKTEETQALPETEKDEDKNDESSPIEAIVVPFMPVVMRAHAKGDGSAVGTKGVTKNTEDSAPINAEETSKTLKGTASDVDPDAFAQDEDTSSAVSQIGKRPSRDPLSGATTQSDSFATVQEQAAASPRPTLGDAESFARNMAFGARAENGNASESSAGQTGQTSTLSVGATTASISGTKTVGNVFAPVAFVRASAARGASAVEQISVQVSKMVKDGESEITINLKPPELGKVQVKLTFSADNKTHALVTADSQGALDLLMKEQNSLTRALVDAGLQLDSGALEFSLSHRGDQDAASGDGRFSGPAARDVADYGDSSGEGDSFAEETYFVTPGRVNIRI